MNRTLLFAFPMFMAIGTNAQNLKEKDRRFSFDDYPSKKIILDSSANIPKKVVLYDINSINIIDSRYSTKSLGFITAQYKKIKQGITGSTTKTIKTKFYSDESISKLVIEGSQENSIKQYLSSVSTFSPSSAHYSLLVVIKSLWLTDRIDFIGKRKFEINEEEQFTNSGIVGNFEFYIYKEDNYWPVFRYEKNISNTMALKEYAKQYLELFLDSSLIKISTIDLNEIIKSKKTLKWDQIKKYNNQRFETAILKDSVCKRGVYRNFNEFKNNTPFYTEFKIEKNKLADILTVKGSDGKEFVERNAWGYCDGTKSFIQNDNNYFELSRVDSCFFVKITKNKIKTGELNTSAIANPYGGGIILPPTSSKYNYIRSDYMPFCLNMDTGEIY